MPDVFSLRALAAAAALAAAPSAAAQTPPSMECGRVQANMHIRCTAIGATPLSRERRAYWSDVPGKETLSERYLEESECHAGFEARCDPVSEMAASYSTIWSFDQALGSKGCEEGASGNGWVDPYFAWRSRITLPRRFAEKTWLLTIVAGTVTAPTIRAYPNPAVAIAPCHLLITGVGTSKDIAIARGEALSEQRETLSGFSPGDYLAELQCPPIQGTECSRGKASVSLQITASPDDR